MGVMSGRTKGSFCSSLLPHKPGARSRLVSEEAHVTLSPVISGGQRYLDTT